MHRRILLRAFTLAVVLPLLGACKDEKLTGTYTATTFTYAEPGQSPVDVLAAGGNITLTIFNDFGTSGSLVMPGSITGNTGNTTVSLLGTSAKNGDQVTLALIADSFMRDMVFTFDGTSLSGTKVFSGTTVVVTLSK